MRRDKSCYDYVCTFCKDVVSDLPTYKEEYNPGCLVDRVNRRCKCKKGHFVRGVYCCDCERIVDPEETENPVIPNIDFAICNDCLENYAIPEYALKFGEFIAPTIEVNAFFEYVLGKDGINEALMEYMKNHPEKFAGTTKKFCLDRRNKTEFAEFILINDIEI